MKHLIILAILFASSAQATCLPSKGTVITNGRTAALIWDIQMPGAAYRISAYGDWIAVRENGSWKRTKYGNVLSYKPNAVNVTTCTLSKILWVFQSHPGLWQQ